MNEPFCVVYLPEPPSINASYMIGKAKGGEKPRIIATDALRKFKEESAEELPLQKGYIDYEVVDKIKADYAKKEHTPIEVTLVLTFATMWKRDLDAFKAAIDAVFKFLDINDNCMTEIHAIKRADPDNQRVMICLALAEDPSFWQERGL